MTIRLARKIRVYDSGDGRPVLFRFVSGMVDKTVDKKNPPMAGFFSVVEMIKHV
jgi:hypothetical protein